MISFLLVLSCPYYIAKGQEIPADKDSLKIYKSIESFARKKGFTYSLYKVLFHPVIDLNKKKSKRLKVVSLDKYQGKIIRNIFITTFDPFGFDINDTTQSPDNFLEKTGNNLHVKTLEFAIRNQLLFQIGDSLDALEIRESERILRSSPYIKDVLVYPGNAGKDSVDIYIREIDLWTTIIKFTSVGTDTKLHLIEKDFIGTGHQLENSIHFVPENNNIYESIYTIPNFKNTFITTSLFYKSDFDSIFYNGISINRPFFSPLTKWAGGLAFSNATTSDTLFYIDLVKTIPNVKYSQYDVWAGKSWQLFKSFDEGNRITNLVLASRYLNTDFRSNPLTGTDSLGFITDEKFYLSSLGISQRLYVKDRYIFKFGLPEDVPTGQVISFTIGKQNKGVTDRTWIGARIGWGNYIEHLGYLAANIEFGTFKNRSSKEQGILSADITYFTSLVDVGQWKLRQFINPRLTIGSERFPTDALNINEENGIRGFSSSALYGTKRFVFSSQTQLYAPYSFIGFRIAPILYFTGALLSSENESLRDSRLYSSIGFGFLLQNELLVLNNFQISFAFYPVIPGLGSNLFKLNSLKSYDFRLRDFDLEKPGTIAFQ